jgi:hypothetical protein
VIQLAELLAHLKSTIAKLVTRLVRTLLWICWSDVRRLVSGTVERSITSATPQFRVAGGDGHRLFGGALARESHTSLGGG